MITTVKTLIKDKSTIRIALEEGLVVGVITLASSLVVLLGTNIELSTRPILIAGLGALITGATTYARLRKISVSRPGG